MVSRLEHPTQLQAVTLIVIATSPLAWAASSSGCGGSLPLGVSKGSCTTRTLSTVEGTRSYFVCVPSSYVEPGDGSSPVVGVATAYPLVLNFHGWGGTIENDLTEAQVWAAVQEEGAAPAIVVHPQGYADNPRQGSWGSWHINGTAESPGPAGPTCTAAGGSASYCYDSCAGKCDVDRGCSWTTCVDDYAFVHALLNEVEASFCIDTTREYATGCSNGGMMAYGLGANVAHRFAAVAPQCGSFHNGFLDSPDPTLGMPLMDVRGDADTRAPANVTKFNAPGDVHPLSADGTWCAAGGVVCMSCHKHKRHKGNGRGCSRERNVGDERASMPLGARGVSPGRRCDVLAHFPFVSLMGARSVSPLPSIIGWYYSSISDVTDAWRVSNGCRGDAVHFPTRFDGSDGLYVCVHLWSGNERARCSVP
jgi:poly(3-hydroxybutyrate) depolymerase